MHGLISIKQEEPAGEALVATSLQGILVMRNNTERVVFYRYICETSLFKCNLYHSLIRFLHILYIQVGRYYKFIESKKNVWNRVSKKRRKC